MISCLILLLDRKFWEYVVLRQEIEVSDLVFWLFDEFCILVIIVSGSFFQMMVKDFGCSDCDGLFV